MAAWGNAVRKHIPKGVWKYLLVTGAYGGVCGFLEGFHCAMSSESVNTRQSVMHRTGVAVTFGMLQGAMGVVQGPVLLPMAAAAGAHSFMAHNFPSLKLEICDPKSARPEGF